MATVVAQFQTTEGTTTGPPLSLPADASPEQLELLLNQLLSNEEPLPYSFFVGEKEIAKAGLSELLSGAAGLSTEEVMKIVYVPQAIFRVRAVTRCSSTLPGHAEAIISVSFSPDGRQLATGSGDATVRIWDLNTETPQFKCEGHKNWITVVAWSPDCGMLASGSMDSTIRVWEPKTGKQKACLSAHSQYITALCWEPLHLASLSAPRLASSSKDGTVRVWTVETQRCLYTVGGHTGPVSSLRWTGDGLLISGSRDRTIRVLDAKDGKLCRTLAGHAHWINYMALSTDFVLRSGPYDHTDKRHDDPAEAREAAQKRYREAAGTNPERLVSCSDDFTMFLWTPSASKTPIARLTGHQGIVNMVAFSPDGRLLVSASFDKSVKLWDGVTGKGHVGPVYQVSFSSDSRMVVSGSKDSTLKLWDLKTGKIRQDLPGHADEVYSVDWSPGGDKVASGGKDKNLKIWRQ